MFMKKALFLIALMLGSVTAFAQKMNKNEVKQLQAFAAQTSEKGGTNGEALKITDMSSPSTWEGITVENGRVVAIQWKDKHLAGELNLSGFTALKKVDVSRNAITSINVTGDAALSNLNASRNKLSNLTLSGNTALTDLSIYRNRLTDVNLTNTPLLTNLNCSNNLFVELSVANATTLKTLNCQGCHLEALNVEGCAQLKPDICLSESSLGVLKELRAYGCGLGIITDGRSIGQRNKLKALGLDDMMDYVSVSEEIKADKLSSYPFQRAIDYFGDDCSYVYIGDNPAKDFMHPNAMGWHTMMLKESSPGMNVHPQGLTDIGHLCRPDIVITDICEVADIVRRL